MLTKKLQIKDSVFDTCNKKVISGGFNNGLLLTM